ncbi:hypothetical protein F7725_019413 [Dissostichus mawsoni]|uniref:Ig-like domain-containing protein n=1 Tax=Dissostichus mawsoni TaxID=36200 RepID=A0A7J5YJN3_DISMA|nr:hypothetical protein F7725_019413 [Dissostichus mawsoni]
MPGKTVSLRCIYFTYIEPWHCYTHQRKVRLTWVDESGTEIQEDSEQPIKRESSCDITLTVTLQSPGNKKFRCIAFVDGQAQTSVELGVRVPAPKGRGRGLVIDLEPENQGGNQNTIGLAVGVVVNADDVIYADIILPVSPDRLQRKEVVFSVLGELQEATESTGLDALTRVALEVDQVLVPFLLPEAPCQDFPEWAGVDYTSQGLYPADAPMGLLPLNCKGEGNLLFDAVSMLLVGHTGLSLELQVRTVLEMVLWKRYYLSGMIDSKVMLQAVRFGLCAEESEYMLNLPATVLEAILMQMSKLPASRFLRQHVARVRPVLSPAV